MQGNLPSECRALALKGPAGTGKTYVIGEFMKQAVMKLQKAIALTAPTNKAVKVLRTSAKFRHKLVMYKTIHSLLGLKEDIDQKTGERKFIPSKDPDDIPKIAEVGILIVDEVSMLNNELFHLLNPYIEKGLKIVFMGDSAQIPPVKSDQDCIPFMPRERTRHGIREIELTEIVRQKEGNPILELATATRENLNAFNIPFGYKTIMNAKEEGIIMINKQDKTEMFQVCDHYFTNMRFAYDSDFMKVICWTNKTVDWMNDRIRQLMYPEEYANLVRMEKEAAVEYGREFDPNKAKLPRILIGEKLIADEPITCPDDFNERERRVQYTTNDEFEVLDYEIIELNVFHNYNVSVYRTQTQSMDANTGKMKKETIDIVHESSFAMFNKVLDIMRKRALDEENPDIKRQNWRKYFSVSNMFAKVKYNYAITAHKAQGSTYQNCMVIEAEFDRSPNVTERNRMKYVAYTRAKQLLFIIK